MLSLFPSLLSWGQVSPLILRLTLGAVFLYWASGIFKGGRSADVQALTRLQEKFLYVIEAAIAVFLILGLWTQGAALVAAIDLIIRIGTKIYHKSFFTNGVNYYFILLILALSLLLTGAGIFAYDMPL